MRKFTGVLLTLSLLSGPAFAATGAATDTVADDDWGDDNWTEETNNPIWTGFIESAAGARLKDDPVLAEEQTLADLRLRLEITDYHGDNRYTLKGDLYADGVSDVLNLDLREATYSFSVQQSWDFKLGQQILTWGTGDLVFLNDMFPKDWQSYFSGRDTEYLKAPVAAIKGSYFGDQASIDLIWMPQFTPDRYIDGERFSYFSPLAGQNIAAPAGKIDADEPDSLLDSELALRIFGTFGSNEWALYGYRGFQKQPNALDSQGRAAFTRLDVLGASIRGNLGRGLANIELALHMAEDDAGSDPLTPNDQLRVLLRYEQELLPKLTLGLQYYLEQMLDYSEFKGASSSPFEPDQYRHLYTTRLRYRMWQDNLILSLFAYYSPSDQDHFIRPMVSYRFDDNLSLALGANIFSGEQPHTFFGQFEDATNVYARLRYAF